MQNNAEPDKGANHDNLSEHNMEKANINPRIILRP